MSRLNPYDLEIKEPPKPPYRRIIHVEPANNDEKGGDNIRWKVDFGGSEFRFHTKKEVRDFFEKQGYKVQTFQEPEPDKTEDND